MRGRRASFGTDMKYLPNVAYMMIIDKQYVYFGSHSRNKSFIYESTIKANSGNRLARECNLGLISREEYNARVELVKVWEFPTKREALEMEKALIKYGKETYGDKCFNVFEGNNETYIVPDEHKRKMKDVGKQAYQKQLERNPKIRDFYVECGNKNPNIKTPFYACKPVEQYKDGVLIATFPSTSNASKETGVDEANMRKVLKGRKRMAGGFEWRYKPVGG